MTVRPEDLGASSFATNSTRPRRVRGEPVPDDALTTRASDVRSRSIRWAWRGRLPLGYLTVWTGIEGVGKSLLAAWTIARLSEGELPGHLQNDPANVLVVASEDGIEDTWKPRLDLADADLDRVHFLNLDRLPGWNIYGGVETLRRALQRIEARGLFIDAALDHVPPPTKAGDSVNNPTFVREALQPLRRMTRALDLTGLYSMHPPKAKGATFRDLVQASQAFSAVPRVGLYVAYHPDDDADDPDCRRVLVRGKGNLGRNPGALEFRVAETPYEHDDGRVQGREYVTDVAPSEVSLGDLLGADRVSGPRVETKTQQAATYLEQALADGQWHPSAPLLAELRERKLDSASVRNAACRRLGVQTRKRDESNGPWEWRLPAVESEGADA